MTTDEDVRLVKVNKAAGEGVIMRWCSCNVDDDDTDSFAGKRVAFRIFVAYLLAIDITVDGSEPFKISEPLGYLEVTDVSCVPYFTTLLKIGEDFFG